MREHHGSRSGYNGGRGVPFVHPNAGADAPVHGEVWELDDEALAAADSLEGHPGWYCREVVGVVLESGELVEAQIYLNKHIDDTEGSVEPAVRLRSGDFRELPPWLCDAQDTMSC